MSGGQAPCTPYHGRSVTPFFVLVLDTTLDVLNELIVHIEEYRDSGESLPMADMTTL